MEDPTLGSHKGQRFADGLEADLPFLGSLEHVLFRNLVAVLGGELYQGVEDRDSTLGHLIQLFRLRLPLRHGLAVNLRHVLQRDARPGRYIAEHLKRRNNVVGLHPEGQQLLCRCADTLYLKGSSGGKFGQPFDHIQCRLGASEHRLEGDAHLLHLGSGSQRELADDCAAYSERQAQAARK